MKLKNIRAYPFTLRNIGGKGLLSLLINLPYYCFMRRSTRYLERKVNDYRMLIDLHDKGISRELCLYGTREKEHSIFLNETLKKGMVVLDIGANIGYYSIMMGNLVGEEGKVYAVEPAWSNYELLRLNIRLNGLENIVETFNMGISNKTGTGKFYQSQKANWHTFYPKVHSGKSTESLVESIPIEVPAITIRDFAEGKPKIDLIRMDIEGFEVEVLESMTNMLSRDGFMPRILFEVHQPRYDDREHNMRGCLQKLFETGYFVKRLASHITQVGESEVFHKKGYRPIDVIRTDGVKREIFVDISNEDAIALICDTELVRTVLLEVR